MADPEHRPRGHGLLRAAGAAVEAAGAFAVYLELVPDRVTELISKKLKVPVFGIGCGPHVDGQFLNIYDLCGMFDRFTPKFVKKYGSLSQEVVKMLPEGNELRGKAERVLQSLRQH